MKHRIHSEIEIAASPGTVWAHLTDLASYVEWNPFIPSAAGTAEVGARLSMRLQPPGGRPLPIKPQVTEVVPGEVFEWLGHLGVPGVFDGRHRFELTGVPSGTRLVQSESFRGLLVRPLKGFLDGATLAGFEAMNAALARRSEQGRTGP
ncbi:MULTISPECIES: SRPBCC family protein [unclassified Blastococcus]